MKKIVLLCSGGMSTGMLVKKMEKYAAETNYECKIEAYGFADAKRVTQDADCILVGPQLKFAFKEVQAMCKEGVPVYLMSMAEYGGMKGDVFVKKARELMGD